jgi:hypothetical protein
MIQGISMDDDSNRTYVMVATQRGTQQEVGNEIRSFPGMIRGPAVDMIDVIHGSFDFITFSGAIKDDDTSILDVTPQPSLLRTETMIPHPGSNAKKASRSPRTWGETRRRGYTN